MWKSKKNKVKSVLLKDFVELTLISNFLKNDFSYSNVNSSHLSKINKLKNISFELVKIFDKILFHLDFKDDSFVLLCSQLKDNNAQFNLLKNDNFKNIDLILEKVKTDINNIAFRLKLNLNELKVEIKAKSGCQNLDFDLISCN